MKIAELFVELGFKVQGEDKLKAFEVSLTNAASAATRLVVAMRMLAGLKVPDAYRNLRAIKVAPGATATPAQSQGAFDQPDAGTGIQKGLKDISKLLGVLGLAGILKGLITSLKGMMRDSLKSQFELNQFTKQTQMTREEVKRWEYLGTKAGMSAEDIQQQMLSLQDRAQEILMGKREPAAPSLGLTAEIGKPADLIRQLEAATRGRSPAEMRTFAQAYGVDPRLIVALRDFPTAMEEAGKNTFVTPEGVKNLNNLNDAFKELDFVVRESVTANLAVLAPLITDVVHGLTDFLRTLQSDANPFIGFFEEMFKRAPGLAPTTTVELNRLQDRDPQALSRSITNNITVNTNGGAKETADALKRALSDFYYDRRSAFPYPPELVSP